MGTDGKESEKDIDGDRCERVRKRLTGNDGRVSEKGTDGERWERE